jgi:hypothetical protein
MNANRLIIYIVTGALLFAACKKNSGPSVDDYFLNYEIPDIPVTEN